MFRFVAATMLTLGVASLSGCNGDQEACDDIAGNGKYTPVKEDGNTYCENPWNGDRFLLH